LPEPPPLPVRSVEVAEDTEGRWTGHCIGMNIFSSRSINGIATPCRFLMEAQVIIHLGGGIAEAVLRGERRPKEVLAFATRHCDMDNDLEKAVAVGGDLRRVTGYVFQPGDLAERTLLMLQANWRAIAALSLVLISERRIEGEDVERIIDGALRVAA